MGNWDDLDLARRYHEATKHSPESVRASGHWLDWDNRPHPFKEYEGLEAEPLPPELERVLRWGAGVIRTREAGSGNEYHFRTYASAGALYPVEIYVATAEGLFHFHPRELAFRRLREGDWRGALVPDAEAVLVLTGILWRTAWKYQARGYRHLFWDAGTILANLLALAPEARLLTGFVDDDVNRLVGVDGEREAALALVALGHDGAPRAGQAPPLEVRAARLSSAEVPYPEAYALHAASSLADLDDVRRFAAGASPAPATADVFSGEEPEKVLRRRGSARTFTLESIPRADLAGILEGASAPIPADFPASNEIFLFAHAVEGLPAGVYRFDQDFELVKPGDHRGWAGYLALDQEHAARAAATHFLMADLEAVFANLGNRGYRVAQLEAGIRAGRIYLGAYARGYGATGLTFYDDEVSDFFETTKSPMLCVAAGPYARG